MNERELLNLFIIFPITAYLHFKITMFSLAKSTTTKCDWATRLFSYDNETLE